MFNYNLAMVAHNLKALCSVGIPHSLKLFPRTKKPVYFLPKAPRKINRFFSAVTFAPVQTFAFICWQANSYIMLCVAFHRFRLFFVLTQTKVKSVINFIWTY